jgi:glutaminase
MGSTDTAVPRLVSTGSLPEPEHVRALLEAAHARYRDLDAGRLSEVYPVLAAADPRAFGLCVVAVTGTAHAVGDADLPFPVMSVSKPFVFALVCEALGPAEARRRIGVNATGLPFNALEAVERSPEGRTNPMVNPGAIATTSLVPGAAADERWHRIHEGLSAFTGRALSLDEAVLASALATNHRNRELAGALAARGALGCAPGEAVELYTRQCALAVTARDLAVMGATLADGGVNPVTGERVVGPETARHALAVMTTAGLYEASGDWLYDIGLPGKSGIGGGIVTVSPGKGGLGTWSPLLDAAGNSVRGVRATRFLARALGLDVLASSAAPSDQEARVSP